MDAPKEEQRGVVRFLTAEGVSQQEISRRMTAVYGEHCMSLATVKRWSKRFTEGRESCKDDPRPGQSHLAITPDTIAQVDELIRQERRISIDELAERVKISHGSVHTIIHDHLGYRLLCAQWMPKILNDRQKTERFGAALTHLIRYHNEGDDFLSAIVTGDESWCHHYEPETRRQSLQWKHLNSPPPKKAKAVISSGKVLLTFFFDRQGPLLIEFAKRGETINSSRYCATLNRLRVAIKNKRPGRLTNGVILLHDNARPHVAGVVKTQLAKFKWETLQHPPYSPDLSPCDFHIFGKLKKHLKGTRFVSDDAVMESVTDFFNRQPKEFYETAITRLICQWDKCLNVHGHYF